MKTQILTKHLKAALHIAAKSDIRYYLNGLLVEVSPTETRVAATDGHIAGVFRTVVTNFDRFEIIVPRDTVELAVKMKIVSLELICDGNNYWSLGGIRFTPVDGKFPDYRRIIPNGYTNIAGTYNPALIERFAKVSRDMGGNGNMIIRQSGLDAAIVHLYAVEEFIGVLMPLRGFTEKMPDLGFPTWGSDRT